MKKILSALVAVAFLSGTAFAAEAAKAAPVNTPSDQKLIEDSHKAGPAKKAVPSTTTTASPSDQKLIDDSHKAGPAKKAKKAKKAQKAAKPEAAPAPAPAPGK